MTNTITISTSSNTAYKQIKINSDFFLNSEYFSVKEEENCMIITKHYLDVPEDARRTIRGYFHVQSHAPIGKHEICLEHSTEDEIVIYFDWMGITY